MEVETDKNWTPACVHTNPRTYTSTFIMASQIDDLVDTLEKRGMVMARVSRREGDRNPVIVYGQLQDLHEVYPADRFHVEVATHATPVASYVSDTTAREAREQREREDIARDFMAALTKAEVRANGVTGNAGVSRGE